MAEVRYHPVMITVRLFATLSALAAAHALSAQGCSDAGVCTAGPIGEFHFSPDSLPKQTEPRHMARINYSHGIGERRTVIHQIVPELAIGITDRLGIQAKMPYVSALGELSNEGGTHPNAGIGDAVVSGSYVFIKEKDRMLTGVLGVRLPTGTTDAQNTDPTTTQRTRSLPMPYQTGLGTTDLLFGLIYRRGRLTTALAYQHVLYNRNMNAFDHASWYNDARALGYFESNRLERADDAVARIQYTVRWRRFSFQPGLLGIMHMAEDRRFEGMADPGGILPVAGMVQVPGSKGLTLNATMDVRYRIAGNWHAELSHGSPLLVRKERPDGLTRSMVLNVGLRYAF